MLALAVSLDTDLLSLVGASRHASWLVHNRPFKIDEARSEPSAAARLVLGLLFQCLKIELCLPKAFRLAIVLLCEPFVLPLLEDTQVVQNDLTAEVLGDGHLVSVELIAT